MQTWRTHLPTLSNKANKSFTVTIDGGDGQYAYRHLGWMMNCMDPTTLSVAKQHMRFNHYTTTPELDDNAGADNKDAIELPSNWLSMSNAYREMRVESVRVEQILSIAPNGPPLFIAQCWSKDPTDMNMDYAQLKQLPGIQFQYVRGIIPTTNQSDDAVKKNTSSNPNNVNIAETTDRSYKEDTTGFKAIVVRLKSYRRAKTYFEGDNVQRRFTPLTERARWESREQVGSMMVPDWDNFLGDDLLIHQWYYHCQIGVADPSIGFPPINIRAMLKITFYTMFKTLRNFTNNSLRTGMWLKDRTLLTLDILNDNIKVDDDNRTAAMTAWLAENSRNRLPRRGVLLDHGEEIRNAWNLNPEDDQYEGGHPYLLKEAGTFTNAGGDDNAQWADMEMADGKNLVDGETQLEDTTQLTPVLVDIRHGAAGGFPFLPTGMTAAELSTYLLDHD